MASFLYSGCVRSFYFSRFHRHFPIRITDGANVTLALI